MCSLCVNDNEVTLSPNCLRLLLLFEQSYHVDFSIRTTTKFALIREAICNFF